VCVCVFVWTYTYTYTYTYTHKCSMPAFSPQTDKYTGFVFVPFLSHVPTQFMYTQFVTLNYIQPEVWISQKIFLTAVYILWLIRVRNLYMQIVILTYTTPTIWSVVCTAKMCFPALIFISWPICVHDLRIWSVQRKGAFLCQCSVCGSHEFVIYRCSSLLWLTPRLLFGVCAAKKCISCFSVQWLIWVRDSYILFVALTYTSPTVWSAVHAAKRCFSASVLPRTGILRSLHSVLGGWKKLVSWGQSNGLLRRRCVAVCCSVLSVLQCVAVCCHVLKYVIVCFVGVVGSQ